MSDISFLLSTNGTAAQTQQELDGVTNALARQGKETNTLTQYIKQERGERRTQMFAFRESQAALTGLNIALGGGSDAMKGIAKAATEGAQSFFGMNFALSGMLGGWGTLLALIMSGVAIWKSFSTEEDKANSTIKETNDKIIDLMYHMGELTKTKFGEKLKKDYEDATAAVGRLTKEVSRSNKTVNEYGVESGGIITKTVGTPKEISDAMLVMATAKNKFFKFNEEINNDAAKILKDGNEQDRIFYRRRFDARMQDAKLWAADATKYEKQFYKATAILEENDRKKKIQNIKDQTKTLQEELKKQEQYFSIFTSSISETLNDALVIKFNDILGQENSILEKFLGSIGRKLIAWGAEQVGEAILNAILAQTTQAAAIAALSAEMEVLAATSSTAALAVNVASFGAAGLAAATSFGVAAGSLEAAKALVKFHDGGTVPKFHSGGTFLNASPSTDIPILVRGGETIRTESQEASLKGSGVTIINNFNTPVPHGEWIKSSLQEGLARTGLTIDKYLVNNVGNRSI